MRNAIITIITCLTVGGLISGGVHFAAARASESAKDAAALPPASMSPLDAARLHAAMAELTAIEQQAKVAMAPHQRVAADVLERNRIDARDFQAGRVKVDYETGAITRAVSPPSAPPSKAVAAASPPPKGGAR